MSAFTSGTLRRTKAAATAAVLGAAAALIAAAVGTRVSGPLVFEMTEPMRPPVASGFYGPEIAGDLTFAWTSARADLALAGLDRSIPWRCTFRLRAARAPGVELPRVAVLVDGLTVASRVAPNDFDDVNVDLPIVPGRAGVHLGIATTPTFLPARDPRQLGVQVDRISCASEDGGAPLPRGVAGKAALAAGAFGAAAGLAGVTTAASAAIAAVAACAQTAPLEAGPAAYTGFAAILLRLAVGLALVFAIGVRIVEAVRRVPLAPATRAAVVWSGVLLYAQLLGLFHPSKVLVDAVFHAHRFEAVLAGHYFFTQPMPAGANFPYAIALYVFAAPWARLTADHVSLLRIVVCGSDLAAYLLIYWIVVRTWSDRLVASVALVLCFMLPIAFVVIGNANLTNEFGHAASTATIALAAVRPARRWRAIHAAGLTLLCALGFLSHVSTIALLACMLVALAGLFWWRVPDGRSHALTLLGVTVVAALLSVALYYGHFGEVYRQALRARSASTASSPAAPLPPGLSPGAIRAAAPMTFPQRLAGAMRLTVECFGWPMLLLAAVGAWRAARGPRGDPIALLAGACGVAFVVFVGVGLMRVNPALQRYAAEFITRVALTVSPGVILLAAAGAAWGWRAGRTTRVAAGALVAWAAVLGTQQWLRWFT